MRVRGLVTPALLLLPIVVSGCGGGGSSNPPSNPSNPSPTITSLTPSQVTAGAADTTISVAGTGFLSTSAVKWNGASLTTTYTSATVISAALPASDLANGTTAQVTVVNPAPGGGTSAASTFTVNNPSPVIASASPASLIAGAGATTINITGTGFVPASIINWNGTPLTTTFVSATAMTAALPASDLGGSSAGSITAFNPTPAGGTSAALTFNVNSPAAAITALSPSSVEQGMAGTITLAGTGFEANSTVLWNGSARPTTFVSPTSLQVALTSSDLQSAGQGSLTVSNPAPNANVSSPAVLNITVPAPVITALTPSSIAANPNATGTTNVVITGSNFSSSARVLVDLQEIPTSAVTATSITAQLPANFITSVQSLSVMVLNPSGGVESNAFPFNVTGTPVISSITPAAAPVGSSDLQIAVLATGIFPDSTVLWNGAALATTYSVTGGIYGGPSLTATIPAADLATMQGGTITISSPEESPTTTSAGQAFSVYLPRQVNNLVINPVSGLLYASTPGAAGAMGNSVVGINPLTGAIVSQIPVGSEPTAMAISGDGNQLYVGLNGSAAVRQVDLTTGVAGLQFSLGGGSGVYNPPFTAQGMAVLPGEPNSVAVYGSNGVLAIYDSGVARPNSTGPLNISIGAYSSANCLAFGNSASTAYAIGDGGGAIPIDNRRKRGNGGKNAFQSEQRTRYPSVR